jgi:hypothetical protein
MSRSWKGGSTRAWRRLRAWILYVRDVGKGCRAHREGWCERAGAAPHTCTDRGEVAHHTLGKAVTGDDPAHIVAACAVCNLAIGDPSAAADPPGRSATQW